MGEQEQLRAENEKLKSIVADMDNSARMLVRRDLELRRANDKLKSLDKAKSEFVSIAAHQLRTPLSAISWAHQMLLDDEFGKLTTEQALLLKQSQQSISRMIHLVNDLLNADHLEFGQVVYNKKEVNLVLLLNETIDSLQSIATEKSIVIERNIPSAPAPYVCDSEKLKEALSNLINNAIKYTPTGGRVTIELKVTRAGYTVVVTDTGIGIPELDQSRIFEKFSRADNAKRVDADGSGLGLFIVKKIVEGHGGTIGLESSEGSGTVFTITLPKQ